MTVAAFCKFMAFFELDLIEVMLVFFFACTKQKANGKEESAKAGLVTFKSIQYFESRNLPASFTVPRRSHCQEMSYIL